MFYKKLTTLKDALTPYVPRQEGDAFTAKAPPKKSKGFASSFNFLTLAKKWPEIAGAYLGHKSLPIKLKGGVLTLIVKHQTYAQELRFTEKMLIKKVVEYFPAFHTQIQKINFIVKDNFSLDDYSFHTDVAEEDSPVKTKQRIHPQSPLYRELNEKAMELFHEIDDPDIKKLLKEIFFMNHSSVQK